jgi:hypothetical protein
VVIVVSRTNFIQVVRFVLDANNRRERFDKHLTQLWSLKEIKTPVKLNFVQLVSFLLLTWINQEIFLSLKANKMMKARKKLRKIVRVSCKVNTAKNAKNTFMCLARSTALVVRKNRTPLLKIKQSLSRVKERTRKNLLPRTLPVRKNAKSARHQKQSSRR